MKILLYNPNTTVSMTVGFTPAALNAAGPDTEVIAETAAIGPESIEGYYDEALCVPPMLHRFADLEAEGFDAAIIACFDDTGLDAARSLLCSSLCSASAKARRSSPRTSASGWLSSPPCPSPFRPSAGCWAPTSVPSATAGVFAAGIPVLDLEDPSQATRSSPVQQL